MKINDLEELGFDEVRLKLIFDHTKKINQTDIFEWDDKYENAKACMERKNVSFNVVKKDSNNKHITSYERIKCYYSEIAQ